MNIGPTPVLSGECTLNLCTLMIGKQTIFLHCQMTSISKIYMQTIHVCIIIILIMCICSYGKQLPLIS